MKPISKMVLQVLLLSWFLFPGCKKDELRTSNPPEVPTISVAPCAGRPIVNATLMPVGALSLERSAIKTATAGNKILFVGGSNSDSTSHPSLVVDIYDFVSNSWTTSILEGTFREGIAVTSSGAKIFMAGGGNVNEYFFTKRVDIYDASTNSWSILNLSVARTDMSAASAGDKVVFAGGQNDDMFEPWAGDVVEIYDIPTNSWTKAKLSGGRSQMSSTTVGNKIYFAGGQSGFSLFDNVDIYDVATNTWDTSYLTARKGRVSSITTGNKIYWAGGIWFATNTAIVGTNEVEIRDVNTGVSSLQCLLPSYDFSSAQIGDTLVFFTGNILDDGNTYFEIFNTSTQEWSTGKLNFKITGATVINANNTIYIAGGNDGAGTHYKQVWRMEF